MCISVYVAVQAADVARTSRFTSLVQQILFMKFRFAVRCYFKTKNLVLRHIGEGLK